ncbi:MAG: hypothetical protein M1814_001464 [Vezdaea aestivalis]|nr:MAG: hypothetical protein M1814_001464 [Vezdaea aestivalis]
MHSSGLRDAWVSRLFLYAIFIGCILATATDSQFLFYLSITPRSLTSGRLWPLLTWPTVFSQPVEALFASALIYHLRVVERLWGSRKFASVLLIAWACTIVFLPAALIALQYVTASALTYLPSGPAPLLYALLYQYHAAVPSTYTYYMIGSRDQAGSNDRFTFTDKTLTYIIAAQLALSRFPYCLLPAFYGWTIGAIYRANNTSAITRWRVPAWGYGKMAADIGNQRHTGNENIVLGSSSREERASEVLRRRR